MGVKENELPVTAGAEVVGGGAVENVQCEIFDQCMTCQRFLSKESGEYLDPESEESKEIAAKLAEQVGRAMEYVEAKISHGLCGPCGMESKMEILLLFIDEFLNAISSYKEDVEGADGEELLKKHKLVVDPISVDEVENFLKRAALILEERDSVDIDDLSSKFLKIVNHFVVLHADLLYGRSVDRDEGFLRNLINCANLQRKLIEGDREHERLAERSFGFNERLWNRRVEVKKKLDMPWKFK